MFNNLGAGDGAGFTVASKNKLLEARKEAVQNSIEPGYINNLLSVVIRLTKLTGAAEMPTFAIVSMHTETTPWP